MKRGILFISVNAVLNSLLTLSVAKAQQQAPEPEAHFGALLQFWVLNASTGAGFDYRVRRAEIKFGGHLREDVEWFVSADPAKGLRIRSSPTAGTLSTFDDNKILEDVAIRYSLNDELKLVVGQFKVLTSTEGLKSSSDLLLPERSYLARAYGGRREPGVLISYTVSNAKLSLMSSNGQGTNVDDNTDPKDLHARIEIGFGDEVELAAFTTAGDVSYNERARFGVSAVLDLEKALFEGELIHAADSGAVRTGYVADLGFKLSESVRPVVRYEVLSGDLYSSAVWAGLNYGIVEKNAKIQLAYGRLSNFTFTQNYAPSANAGADVVIASFQAAL